MKAAKDAGAATLNYGIFLNTVINFVIVAIGALLRGARHERAQARAAGAGGRSDRKALSAVRDEHPARGQALSTLHEPALTLHFGSRAPVC